MATLPVWCLHRPAENLWHFNHDILLSKLNHYGIRGAAFDWFKSYISDRTQYVTINNERSEIQTIKYGVPQGSILGPYYFSYINDLSRSIKNSKIHHFADDTNLLYASSSLKDINKKINFDLSNLVQWLRASEIIKCTFIHWDNDT